MQLGHIRFYPLQNKSTNRCFADIFAGVATATTGAQPDSSCCAQIAAPWGRRPQALICRGKDCFNSLTGRNVYTYQCPQIFMAHRAKENSKGAASTADVFHFKTALSASLLRPHSSGFTPPASLLRPSADLAIPFPQATILFPGLDASWHLWTRFPFSSSCNLLCVSRLQHFSTRCYTLQPSCIDGTTTPHDCLIRNRICRQLSCSHPVSPGCQLSK